MDLSVSSFYLLISFRSSAFTEKPWPWDAVRPSPAYHRQASPLAPARQAYSPQEWNQGSHKPLSTLPALRGIDQLSWALGLYALRITPTMLSSNTSLLVFLPY